MWLDHVNLKGKLINWNTGNSSTSSPHSTLCFLTLGKNLPRAPEKRDQIIQWWSAEKERKNKRRPPISIPSSDPPPTLHLPDYECMSKEGRSDKKEPEQEETFKSQTGVKCINSAHSVRYTNTDWLLHGNRIVWSLEGIHRLYTNSTEAGHTLGKHTLCKHGKRPFSFVTDMQTYRDIETTDTSPVFSYPYKSKVLSSHLCHLLISLWWHIVRYKETHCLYLLILQNFYTMVDLALFFRLWHRDWWM